MTFTEFKDTHSRRGFLKTLSLSTFGIVFLPHLFTANSPLRNRPNILFILSDDHAANAISCYGSKINETPNIDRIANGGVRFNNCFCTNSICAPSRASILTGKYSHITGVIDNSKVLHNSHQTFPKLLQEAGYETAIVGKWHLKNIPRGFDYWSILPGQGDYYNPDFRELGKNKRFTGYVTDLITDQALNWLNNRNKKKPFCLLYQHKAPHSNWMPPVKYLLKFDDVDIPEPVTFHDDYKTRSDAAKDATMRISDDFYYGWHLKLDPKLDQDEKIRKLWMNAYYRMNEEQREAWDAAYGPKNKEFYESNLTGNDLAHWKYERYIKDYLRCVASLDDNIGRILNYLDLVGLTENTLVVYTSDQGFFLGDHGWWDKRFMYEESIRMPLLVRYPKEIKHDLINDNIVLNIDFAPTLLDFAGVITSSDMQGKSFRKLLEGRIPKDWRTSMYYHYYEYPGRPEVKKHYGIRTERYKLIHFYDDIDVWELYDLKEDPNEINNFYNDPNYSEIVIDLKTKLHKLQIEYNDTENYNQNCTKEIK